MEILALEMAMLVWRSTTLAYTEISEHFLMDSWTPKLNPSDFDDPLTFPLAPPAGSHLVFSSDIHVHLRMNCYNFDDH